jgi:hypothetical protein
MKSAKGIMIRNSYSYSAQFHMLDLNNFSVRYNWRTLFR